jgi:hypothetical protein
VALIDDADYELVSRYRWHAWEVQRPGGRVDGPYAAAATRQGGRKTSVLMHKLITGHPITDHANGDGLDNRRANLRLATTVQNGYNRRSQTGHSSQYKGVTWHKQRRKWQACIKVDGKNRYLGIFSSEEEAAAAYVAVALEAQGAYAYAARPELCQRDELEAARQVDPDAPMPLRRNNTSGVRGVVYQPSISAPKPWRAQIMVNRKCTYLGLFEAKEAAIAARLEAEADVAAGRPVRRKLREVS